MYVRNQKSIRSEDVNTGRDTTRKILTDPDAISGFVMRKFVISPGGSMPLHTNLVEHQQYVLKGNAKMIIGDEEYDVKCGDIVYIPAGTRHCYQAFGTEDFEFICVVPQKEDEIKLLDPDD